MRYALYALPTNPHVCHCRMCSEVAATSRRWRVPLADFAWLKGTPGVFHSSEAAERGFCRDCGTPLFFRYVDRDRIAISLGSLDDPSGGPEKHDNSSRLGFVARLATLPGTRTEDDVPAAEMARLKSRHTDRTGLKGEPMTSGLKLVIHVSDWKRSNAFYRDVMGAELIRRGNGWAYRLRYTQLKATALEWMPSRWRGCRSQQATAIVLRLAGPHQRRCCPP